MNIGLSTKAIKKQHASMGSNWYCLRWKKKVNLVFLKEVFFDASNDRPS